jgi:phosphate/sulfate permease
MVYGLWFMVYGLWFMVYGLWFMVYGLWFMVYGLWFRARRLIALMSSAVSMLNSRKFKQFHTTHTHT